MLFMLALWGYVVFRVPLSSLRYPLGHAAGGRLSDAPDLDVH
eukprot:gene9482-8485_t